MNLLWLMTQVQPHLVARDVNRAEHRFDLGLEVGRRRVVEAGVQFIPVVWDAGTFDRHRHRRAADLLAQRGRPADGDLGAMTIDGRLRALRVSEVPPGEPVRRPPQDDSTLGERRYRPSPARRCPRLWMEAPFPHRLVAQVYEGRGLCRKELESLGMPVIGVREADRWLVVGVPARMVRRWCAG